MAHKSLKGRKKPKKATSVRRRMKSDKHNKKQSRDMKEKARKKKEEEREKKAAQEAARKEAALAARKAEEEAAQKAAEEAAAQAAAPKGKKGKKRKAAAVAPEPVTAATELAPAAEPVEPEGKDEVEEPAKPLKRKEKKLLKMQAALARHHQLLYGSGRILLVGEGNFSFARGLCRYLEKGEGVFATCYDGESLLKRKYPDAAEIRKEVEDKYGGTTLVGVDATRLHEVREFRKSFRTIVWNFPHIGGGESDVEKSIGDHQRLLAEFFKSAVRCLSEEDGASIHVSLKSGEPYKSWKVKQTAKMGCPDLELSKVVAFAPSAWSGYEHRRTVGFDERFSKRDSAELAAGAKVFVFTRSKAAGQAAE